MQPTIVFVQLGENPSPSLMSMANSSKGSANSVKIYLITDLPESWEDFPGEIVNYQKKHRDEFILKFIKRNPELNSISGGYWLYTLERLFALKRIYDVLTPAASFVHLESDVLSLLHDSDFQLLREKVKRVACPRFSKDRGIASVFFVPNEIEYDRTLKAFTHILNGPDAPRNDMDLLGACLNSGQIEELPSLPWNAWENSNGEKLIFDGAAYGQYLFGQDPFHTKGSRISGFQNPDFTLDLSNTRWEVLENEQYSNLYLNYDKQYYRLLNLHIHSKLELILPSLKDFRWNQAIAEANKEIERIFELQISTGIHDRKISLLNRLRLAKRKGIVKSLINAAAKRIKKQFKRLRS